MFWHLQYLEKYFLTSCLLLWKHLLIMDILLEVTSESPPNETGGISQGLWTSTQPLKMPTDNHPPVIKSNTVTRFKIISGLRNSLQKNRQKQAKTFSFNFSITRQHKNLKTIGAYTERTDWICEASKKNYSSRDTIPLNPSTCIQYPKIWIGIWVLPWWCTLSPKKK
jgi:hypothetical protein